jgi:hypothetical protein
MRSALNNWGEVRQIFSFDVIALEVGVHKVEIVIREIEVSQKIHRTICKKNPDTIRMSGSS